MEKNTNVLILEDDERTAGSLKSHLRTKQGIDMVESVPSVQEACEFLRAQDMDIVVLDLIMSVSDGYTFLENLGTLDIGKKPEVIVTSAIDTEMAIKKAFEMGAKYYMIKPYENEIMYRRILDVLDLPAMLPSAETPAGSKTVDQRIMEIFLTLGIPPHLKGYQYLRAAIKMAMEDPSLIYAITKQLYPGVAEQFGVTATKVELAIRHTLDVSWQRGSMQNMDDVFGCNVYLKNNKPTNGEFIAVVADLLCMEQGR